MQPQIPLQAWLRDIESLLSQVEGWCRTRGWATRRDQKEIDEWRLGRYVAPVLIITSPATQLQLEPIARYVSGDTGGRVDILAWPTLNRLMLIRTQEGWSLKTDSGLRWPQAWNDSTFAELADALGAAA